MIQPFELGTDDIAATVTQLPKGFTGAGVNCGVRKYRPDLGLIVSDFDCAASGVFTKNKDSSDCHELGASQYGDR